MICDAVSRPSSRQIAEQSVERFRDWIAERDIAGDWDDYIRLDKLNRSEIAKECSFLRTVFRTNPGVAREMAAVETRLRERGVLQAMYLVTADQQGEQGCDSDRAQASADPAVQMALRRAVAARAKADQRVKLLEEQNATLRAEVNGLRDQVRKLNFMDEHLAQSGRLLQP